MYSRLVLNSRSSCGKIIHVYHFAWYFLHNDQILLRTVPWWLRWLPNKSVYEDQGRREREAIDSQENPFQETHVATIRPSFELLDVP